MLALPRNLILDVHLPGHNTARGGGDIVTSDEEIALFGDRQRIRSHICGHQCSVGIPASLMTLPHLMRSAFIAAASSAGVVPSTSEPLLKNRSLTSGRCTTRTIS